MVSITIFMNIFLNVYMIYDNPACCIKSYISFYAIKQYCRKKAITFPRYNKTWGYILALLFHRARCFKNEFDSLNVENIFTPQAAQEAYFCVYMTIVSVILKNISGLQTHSTKTLVCYRIKQQLPGFSLFSKIILGSMMQTFLENKIF